MPIRVDSAAVILTPNHCGGVGIGFISRIDDRLFLAEALKGLIESNAQLRFVTAFYRTEVVDFQGRQLRAPRALTVSFWLRSPVAVMVSSLPLYIRMHC